MASVHERGIEGDAVMNLVRGMPITEYCDKGKLPLRDRLHLFITVCQAVQGFCAIVTHVFV
jgi:eukaryotic-like serine/threonine-protein kinase